MKATVTVINPERGMYAAETQDNEFVVFELRDADELEIGDVVIHPNFNSLGSEEYRNATQDVTISVYVEDLVGTIEQAKKQCFV